MLTSPEPLSTDRQPSRRANFASVRAEWEVLNQGAAGRDALHRWAQEKPVLAGAQCLDDFVLRVDGAGHEEADAILLALIELAQAGQSLAGRVVIQCLLPGLRKLVRWSYRWSASVHACGARELPGSAELEHAVVAELWIRIMEYPVAARPARVAANLVWDTRKQTVGRLPREVETFADPDRLRDETIATADTYPSDLHGTAPTMAHDLRACLDWAKSVEALSAHEVFLLEQIYLDKTGAERTPSQKEMADELGISYAALRQQVARAKQRLVSAIRAEVLDADDVAISCAG